MDDLSGEVDTETEGKPRQVEPQRREGNEPKEEPSCGSFPLEADSHIEGEEGRRSKGLSAPMKV